MDRRTACLHQANAFREKALADPEHHDQWIDEAIKWLERAIKASCCRANLTVEADNGNHVPDSTFTAITETLATGSKRHYPPVRGAPDVRAAAAIVPGT